MAATPLSPSSSPRLPSPPPIAEDQLGPKSPLPATEEQQKLFSNLDHGAARRIRPGTKAEDMTEGPPLVDLSEIDSAFQLTEHLKALHNFLTHPIGTNTTLAIDREMAHRLAHPPENIDNTLWLYELCRFLTQKVNSFITALFSDNPPCSSTTCPEMRASEWQYLCAVHEPPKSCCAIDYCCHTLDWAANTLTSPKHFPSRLALGEGNTQHGQMRQLTNIFRRVYRIFAHAWFQHRDMFWKVESRTGLYILFKTVCDVYGLIPEDNYTIPPEAEGDEQLKETSAPPLILKRAPSGPGPEDMGNSSVIGDSGDHSLSTAGTTVRHRHSPSVGATAVSTVVEEAEEEEEPLTRVETAAQEPPAEAESEEAEEEEDEEEEEEEDEEDEEEEEEFTILEEPETTSGQSDAAEADAEDSHAKEYAPDTQGASIMEAVEAELESDEKESEVFDTKTLAAEAKDDKNTVEAEDASENKSEGQAEKASVAEPEKAEKEETNTDIDKVEQGLKPVDAE